MKNQPVHKSFVAEQKPPDLNDPEHRIRQLEAENTRLRQQIASDRRRTAERDLRSILDNLPSMVGYWSRDRRNRFANHAYFAWFGIDPATMPGRHMREILGEERYRLNLPYIEAALRGEPQQFERAIPSPDGKTVRHSLTNYIPDIVAGEVLGFYVLVTDITAIKQAEEALREAQDSLELRVVERTEQLRRLAVESTLSEARERQAIATDLHDNLGQLLHVARIKLDAMAAFLPPGASLNELNDLLSAASREVRMLTSQLSPPILKRLGLAAALRWLVDEMHRQYGLRVSFLQDAMTTTPSEAQGEMLFRAARELLINVVKHAGTRQASLYLAQEADQIVLTVEDQGIGMADPDNAVNNTDAFGLASIRERITYLSGHMEITRRTEGGLRVVVRLPLPPSESARKPA